jgi:hypothetical protein
VGSSAATFFVAGFFAVDRLDAVAVRVDAVRADDDDAERRLVVELLRRRRPGMGVRSFRGGVRSVRGTADGSGHLGPGVAASGGIAP